MKLCLYIGDWGLGIGDWGLGIGEWARSPIPNPQSPIPNPQSPIPNFFHKLLLSKYIFFNFQKKIFLFNYLNKKKCQKVKEIV